MMDVEAQNREYFEAHAPGILGQLNEDPEVTVEPSRRGGLTLIERGVFVHAKYHPEKEARRLVEKVESPAGELHLHFGFGLGYLATADEPAETGVMLIWEPRAALLAAAFRHVPLGDLLRSRRAQIFIKEKDFRDAVREHMPRKGQVRMMFNPYHQKTYPEQARRFLDMIKAAHTRVMMNHSTRSYHIMRTIHGATVRSLRHTTRLPGAERLAGKLANRPAIIAVAGPSLSKNLQDIMPMRSALTIFCVARTASVLESVGLMADFLVHNEAQDFQHLIDDCHHLDRTTFLLDDQCHERYFDVPAKNKLVYQNPRNQVTRWLLARYPHLRKQFIATGGSVATEAFSLALVFGCNPIILVGQDLALTGGRYYSGVMNRAFLHREADRRQTFGYFGGQLDTLANYDHFIHWYEDAVEVYQEQNPDRQFVNATEGGARLRGFEQRKLREVLWSLDPEPFDLEPILAEATLPDPQHGLSRRGFAEMVTGMRREISSLQQQHIRFEAFEKTLRKKLGRGQMDAELRDHVVQLERFAAYLENLRTNFEVLLGFMDPFDAVPNREDAPFLEQLAGDADRVAQFFGYASAGARRLERALVGL